MRARRFYKRRVHAGGGHPRLERDTQREKDTIAEHEQNRGGAGVPG